MSDSDPWAQQWQQAQQQFVDAWSQMASLNPSSAQTGNARLWAEGFERWRKAAGGEGQPEIRSAIDKCLAMGKGYFALAEQLGIGPTDAANPLEGIDRWLKSLGESLRGMSNTPGFDSAPIGDFLRPWFGPGDSWQQMATGMAFGNPLMANLPGMNTGAFNFGESVDPLGKLLETPGVGYFRESQEQQQKTAQLALAYQQANQRFNQAFLQVAIESLEEFRRRLIAQDADRQPESLRAIYDLWVEVSEHRYARFAMSEEYQRLYGDMVNRLMALRIHLNRLADQLMASMNLPGSREIGTMQQRLQQLRRDNLELRQAVGDIRATLEQPRPAAKTASVAAKKAVARKKVTAKKKAVVKKKAVAKKAARAKTRTAGRHGG